MIRKGQPQLKAQLNDFLAAIPWARGYATHCCTGISGTPSSPRMRHPGRLAKFECTVDVFRKYGEKYELDYLLMMAQGYQESQLNRKPEVQGGRSA